MQVVAPGTGAWDEATAVWNARFARTPSAVARPRDAEETAEAVRSALRDGIPIGVRGGGHSYGGRTIVEGGLLLDLSLMRDIRIDLERATVTVGAGVTCGDLDRAAQAYGLAVPLPTVSTVGVIGAALGGGNGYLSRLHGLTADNALAAKVVTAYGEVLDVDEDTYPDLFWALRGAGANFGIVTEMTFRLHPVGPEVLAGQIVYPFEEAASVLRAFDEVLATAPDSFQCYPFMMRVPPVDPFPEEQHGRPVIDLVVFDASGQPSPAIDALSHLGPTVLSHVDMAPYVAVQQAFDAGLPKGHRYRSRTHGLGRLTDDMIDAIVRWFPDVVGELSVAYLAPGGGAIAQTDPDAPPYAGRSSVYDLHILAGWTDPTDDETVITWADGFADAMAPFANGNVYVNLLAEDEDDRIAAAYGQAYERLRELKRRWDPDNVLCANYNIPPAA